MSSYRVVLIGEGGVGKSCLTIQFINERFVEGIYYLRRPQARSLPLSLPLD